mmetsp:Transcript_21560/g.31686  ORF Transcript_21560/g.31686 Transcript_21560/m.31686 type:complete len:261 (+) Transcript_21560:98-880(+)
MSSSSPSSSDYDPDKHAAAFLASFNGFKNNEVAATAQKCDSITAGEATTVKTTDNDYDPDEHAAAFLASFDGFKKSENTATKTKFDLTAEKEAITGDNEYDPDKHAAAFLASFNSSKKQQDTTAKKNIGSTAKATESDYDPDKHAAAFLESFQKPPPSSFPINDRYGNGEDDLAAAFFASQSKKQELAQQIPVAEWECLFPHLKPLNVSMPTDNKNSDPKDTKGSNEPDMMEERVNMLRSKMKQNVMDQLYKELMMQIDS